jgi:hypothetical protein
MAAGRLLAISTATLSLLALPCLAGPCSDDITNMEMSISAKIDAIAAAGPVAGPNIGGQTHAQPTPESLATAERELGEVSARTISAVKDAMVRARKADADGDKIACEQALADARRAIGP